VPTTDIPYKQYHVRVVVDSQQASVLSTGIKPKRTPESEGRKAVIINKKRSDSWRGTKLDHWIGTPGKIRRQFDMDK
jgi:hypothetical protein